MSGPGGFPEHFRHLLTVMFRKGVLSVFGQQAGAKLSRSGVMLST
jgi:hypothetical protein